MKILKTNKECLNLEKDLSLGFVATMGALHEGHQKLIETSQKENEKTIVSLFVNPTQFNNPNDFETYPNLIEEDLAFCKKSSVDYVFCPDVEEIYTEEESIKFKEEDLSLLFEGTYRPGHFAGVLTVILKMLNIIKPTKAYFGKKDYQQYLLIDRLQKNFFLDTTIVGVDTCRDEFGLALSSRNFNLSKEGLIKARKVANRFLKTSSEKDFLESVKDLSPEIEYYGEKWGRALMAHYVDGVRLIDNKALGEGL